MGTTISISFANELRTFWQEWNIRIFVLLSQFLQIVLCFLMPHRKSSSNSFILWLIKTINVLSTIAAGVAITYISEGMPGSHGYQPVLVLWASFILLHFAGSGQTLPYTIDEYDTSYTNGLNYIFHGLSMFALILLQRRQVALPAGWTVIAMVAFIASWIKVQILMFGKSDFRARHLLHRRKLHNSKKDVNITAAAPAPEVIEEAPTAKKLDEVDLVSKAFKYYESSKRLFLGLSFTRTEREQSRKDFLELNPKDAVRVVEITLNLAYDAYYKYGVDPYLTKCSRLWMSAYFMYLFVLMGFFATLAINPSFLSFSSQVEDKYKGHDWTITRILCFSNVLLPFMTILRLPTSDYAIACWDLKRLAQLLSHMRRWGSSSSTDGNRDAPKSSSINFLLSFAQSRLKSLPRVFFRRWSETISTRSFMIECLITTTKTDSLLVDIPVRWYVTPSTYGSQRYNDDIGKFIFTNLKDKDELYQSDGSAGVVLELLGDWILRKQGRQASDEASTPFLDSILHLPFDIRLLLWHIATEILYSTREQKKGNDDECRKMSNILSEYMMYLTFECSPIMSRLVGNFLVRFHDIIKYIREKSFVETGDWRKPPQERLKRFYNKITEDYNNGKEIEQPVLHLAVEITKELEVTNENMWKVISDEWVEMLVYAATNSDPKGHIEKLAEGGELITIVWLLYARLGFGDYFLAEKQEGKDQAKEDEKEEVERQEDKDQAKEDEKEDEKEVEEKQEDKDQAKEDEKEAEEKQEDKDQAKEEEKEPEISQV